MQEYFYFYCDFLFCYRDIKFSNILFDEEFNVYLLDFGLVRLFEVFQIYVIIDVVGIFGYVVLEYVIICRVLDKADVYSFGVVFLELMLGKKFFDLLFFEYGNGFNIVGWVILLMEEERCFEFFFLELWEVGFEENLLSMMQFVLFCIVELFFVRLLMKQVFEKLKSLS